MTATRVFMGLEFDLDRDVLVPREETELLGRIALQVLGEIGARRVVDMCCGSGNLACALAHALPALEAWAIDLTDACVDLTNRNVRKLGLEKRVHVVRSDLFAGLRGLGLEGALDAVVCNPPYISTGKLEKEHAALLRDEPRQAFDGGPFGISVQQRVIREAIEYLRPGGWLLFEVGLGQATQTSSLLGRALRYEPPCFAHDASGNPRVVYARRSLEQ